MRQSTEIGRVGLATAACAVLALMLTGCSLEAGDFSALGMGSTAAVSEAPSITEPARSSVPRADKPEVQIAANTPSQVPSNRSIAPPPAAVPKPVVRAQPKPAAKSVPPVQVAQATTSEMRARDEAEMLARARAEAAAAEREQAEERHAEEIRQQARVKMEQDREAELRVISERLRRQQESRAAAPPPPPTQPEAPPARIVDVPPPQTPLPANTRDQVDAARPTVTPAEVVEAPKGGRVAVLLVMQAGNRGIRRFEKTGDPLLCTATGCYVSAGTSAPATFLPGRKAFGFTNTMGPRAGACSNSLVCVYRGVQLGAAGDFLQPVDMRLIRHDRRESKPVSEDSRCRISSGGIDCRRPIVGADFRIWIVPEVLAEQAGVRALEQAVQEGLPDQRQASLAR